MVCGVVLRVVIEVVVAFIIIFIVKFIVKLVVSVVVIVSVVVVSSFSKMNENKTSIKLIISQYESIIMVDWLI